MGYHDPCDFMEDMSMDNIYIYILLRRSQAQHSASFHGIVEGMALSDLNDLVSISWLSRH